MAQAMIDKLGEEYPCTLCKKICKSTAGINGSYEQNSPIRLSQQPDMLHLQQTLHQQGSNRESLQDSQTSIGMQKAQTNGRS